MVDKTKRALTILQHRGVETTVVTTPLQDSSIAEIKRQTEEKVAEFRRNAEEAVNQVKRQAVIEIQRAVAAAENRAVEVLSQERMKMEKLFAGKSLPLADQSNRHEFQYSIQNCIKMVQTNAPNDSHRLWCPDHRILAGIVAERQMKPVRDVIWRDIVAHFVNTKTGNSIIRWVWRQGGIFVEPSNFNEIPSTDLRHISHRIKWTETFGYFCPNSGRTADPINSHIANGTPSASDIYKPCYRSGGGRSRR